MSALSLATLGVQCNKRAVAMATLGVICGAVVVVSIPDPIVLVETKSVSGTSKRISQDHFQRKLPIEERVLYSQLYAEDEEVISIVVAMINTGIIR